jgi:hypothetical protein
MRLSKAFLNYCHRKFFKVLICGGLNPDQNKQASPYLTAVPGNPEHPYLPAFREE